MTNHDLVCWRPVPSEFVCSTSTASDVCYSPVVVKRHPCRLIYVGHFIVLLYKHYAIAEMIFSHLKRNHHHSCLTVAKEWFILLLIADVNECEKGDTCGEVANCENTEGSYRCNCFSKGFEYNAKTRGCFGKKCLVGPFCKYQRYWGDRKFWWVWKGKWVEGGRRTRIGERCNFRIGSYQWLNPTRSCVTHLTWSVQLHDGTKERAPASAEVRDAGENRTVRSRSSRAGKIMTPFSLTTSSPTLSLLSFMAEN